MSRVLKHIRLSILRFVLTSSTVEWRIPFGEAGILDFFIGVLSANNIRHNLLLNTLRLIGNTCADRGMLEGNPSNVYTS